MMEGPDRRAVNVRIQRGVVHDAQRLRGTAEKRLKRLERL
jgi:hypothetical protein